jgi:outer membrane protein assembly factor BamB
MASRWAWRSAVLVLGFGLTAWAQDWPQWRGPSRDGVAPDAKLPDPWPAQLRPAWQALVGSGYSGPAAAEGKVVVFVRQGEQEVTLCLNAADGKELWRDSYEAPYTPSPPAVAHGKGPFSTPAIVGGRVYTHGAAGILSCLDFAAGKVLWRDPKLRSFGASSPLVEGNLLIHGVLWVEGDEVKGALTAHNKDTGQLVWRSFADVPAYGSPVVADLAGRRQIIQLMQHKIVGVAAASGTPLWEAPFNVYNEMNIVTPVVYQDRVIFSGYGLGTKAVRIATAGDQVTAEPVWHCEAVSMFISSPVVCGDALYGLATRRGGSIVCVRLDDGQMAWSSPGNLGEYASFVRAGDKLLVLTTQGTLIAVAADPTQYRELGRSRVTPSTVWAHLALAGSRLYVKDNKAYLTCFDLAAQ